jgi:hypothetical protein
MGDDADLQNTDVSSYMPVKYDLESFMGGLILCKTIRMAEYIRIGMWTVKIPPKRDSEDGGRKKRMNVKRMNVKRTIVYLSNSSCHCTF